MTKSLVWVKEHGAELSEVEFGDRSLSAHGTAVGADPVPYRLSYELTTGEDYVTARLLVQADGVDEESGSWRRTLELLHGPGGVWAIKGKAEGQLALRPPGGDASQLAGAQDCDLGLSPLTNTMPVLRSGLLAGGGPQEYLVAWVSVPDLVVVPSRQRYAFVRRDGDQSVINFSSAEFTQDIVFDADGLVVDYPTIGRRA
jgi:uncharacterized protein